MIKSLNKAVAETTDTSESKVATLFWQRLSIDIQRSAQGAFARRLRQEGSEIGSHAMANLELGGLLEMPERG